MIFLVTGICGMIGGGIYYFASQSANTECSSALISALYSQQCNEVSAVHTIALLAVIVGIIFTGIGGYRMGKHNGH